MGVEGGLLKIKAGRSETFDIAEIEHGL